MSDNLKLSYIRYGLSYLRFYDSSKICNDNLQIALNNLPDCFEEVSKQINKSVDEEVQAQKDILGYFCEKFYKIGFQDAISLIFDCLNKKYEE